MIQAQRYVKKGWAVCKIPAGKKGPNTTGWNLEENAITDPAELEGWTGNIGLLHAWSRTCAIDIDDHERAALWLADFDIDLNMLLCADDAVQPRSGKKNSGKLLYRLPAKTDPLKFRSVQVKDDKGMILEFRCAAAGGVTVQDVLPPSTHPDTGKPYTWGGAGNWKQLPELPQALRMVWRDLRSTSKADRKKKPTGPGTSDQVAAFVERLAAAGLKPFRAGKSVRSHCPHHGGVSGTTLKVDEGADGTVLAHCHGGCTFDQIVAGLGNHADPAPRNAAVPTSAGLPDFSHDLLNLPHGLGALQDWIEGRMKYPSRSTAGVCALAVMTYVAMGHVTVDSYGLLGLNEQYLVLAPTGFGKEDLRSPFGVVDKHLKGLRTTQNLRAFNMPQLQYSPPASQQGLHQLLETNPGQVFLSDEFAEWLGDTRSNSHAQMCLGYLMQAYTKATATVAAPHSVGNKYTPVDNPRVLVFATSTGERMLEVMSASQAESGFLNRIVMHVGEQERIAKRYEGMAMALPTQAAKCLEWVYQLEPTVIDFQNAADREAWDYYVQHDSAAIEPLRHVDNILGARISEQAIKIAALIALSDGRTAISVRDLACAYSIREGVYHRAAALIGNDGAISGMHVTGKALAQIEQALKSKPHLYRSHLAKVSRQFGKLSMHDQESVIKAAVARGIAALDGSKLVSKIQEAAD